MNKKNNNRILAVLFTGVLMGALDISIVGPAIPSIEESIKVEPRMLGWIFSIYVLFNLSGVSLFARLSDIYGRRNIYIISLAVFALGSIIVSVSENFTLLLTGRAIQGFGASGIFPVASAVVGDLFPKEKRGRVLGLIGAVFGLAFLIGPILAGVMLHYFKWHSLFLINIPIVVVLIIASAKYIPNTRLNRSGLLDWKGIVSLGLMLASFAYAINMFDAEDLLGSLLSIRVLPFLMISIVLFFILVYTERTAENPILKLSFFQNRQITMAGIIAISTGLVQSSFVFIPDFAVGIFDISSSRASFMLVPLVTATAIGSPVFGRLIDAVGSKLVILLALVLTGTGFFLLSGTENSRLLFYSSGVLIGLGLSVLSGSALRYIMLNETKEVDRAVTQGMLTIFISLGQLTGAAVIGVILASAGTSGGYHTVFLLQAVLLCIIIIPAFLLKGKREELQVPSRDE